MSSSWPREARQREEDDGGTEAERLRPPRGRHGLSHGERAGRHRRPRVRRRHADPPAGHGARARGAGGARARPARVVVNTHHHWDHVYGNAAFPRSDIVAHRSCPRLLGAQAQGISESVPAPPPEGVPAPTVTFGDRLTYVGDDEIGAPHPHARPQRGLDRGLPRRGRRPVRRRHPGVAAADLRPSVTATPPGSARCASSSSCPSRSSSPATGRRWARSSSRPTSATCTGCTRRWRSRRSSGVRRHGLDVPAAGSARSGRRARRGLRDGSPENLEWAYDEV